MSPIPGTRPLSSSAVIGARIVTSLPPCSACAHAYRCSVSPSFFVTSPLAFFHGSGGADSLESGG